MAIITWASPNEIYYAIGFVINIFILGIMIGLLIYKFALEKKDALSGNAEVGK